MPKVQKRRLYDKKGKFVLFAACSAYWMQNNNSLPHGANIKCRKEDVNMRISMVKEIRKNQHGILLNPVQIKSMLMVRLENLQTLPREHEKNAQVTDGKLVLRKSNMAAS